MEIVFLLVWKMRQDIEFHKSRATLQALLSQKGAEDKAILEAFNDLREAFFPFDKNEKQSGLKKLKEAMLKEIKRGALSVTPMVDPNRRKVASRLAQGRADLERHKTMARSGKATGIDAFQRARLRPRGSAS